MEGCLTQDEASKFINIAESIGFQHQGSRGAAYGEVSSVKIPSLEPTPRLLILNLNLNKESIYFTFSAGI